MKKDHNFVVIMLSLIILVMILVTLIKHIDKNKQPVFLLPTLKPNDLSFNKEKNKLYNLKDNSSKEQFSDPVSHSYQEPYINMPPQVPYNGYNIKQQNALDRIYNPLRYPYKSAPFYEQGWYPDMQLPPQVIGCGGRNTPCIGGTQVPIPNEFPPINVSNSNIAPINISTRGPLGEPQQMGVMQKIFGKLNEAYPVYGRKKYPNDNKWEYYTQLGPIGVKVPLITQNRNYNELGTNDEVMVHGNSAKFRVTMYDDDYPQYVPYA